MSVLGFAHKCWGFWCKVGGCSVVVSAELRNPLQQLLLACEPTGTRAQLMGKMAVVCLRLLPVNTAPGMHISNIAAQATRPGARRGVRHDARPGARPGARHDARPGARPGAPHDGRLGALNVAPYTGGADPRARTLAEDQNVWKFAMHGH